MNPDNLRTDPEALEFVRAFAESRKPIAAICHAPWILINCGLVEDVELTSWPSLRVDLENAGARWVDRETVVDRGILTSRKPDDLPAFCDMLIEMLASARVV